MSDFREFLNDIGFTPKWWIPLMAIGLGIRVSFDSSLKEQP